MIRSNVTTCRHNSQTISRKCLKINQTAEFYAKISSYTTDVKELSRHNILRLAHGTVGIYNKIFRLLLLLLWYLWSARLLLLL